LAGEAIDAQRLADARRAFTTRRAHLPSGLTLLMHGVQPRQGDLVLARVTGIGHHSKLELPDGRRSQLYQGDEIVVTYANRYAPDQFEAEIPDNLDDCHLVAAGGIAARMLSRNAKTRNPTRIRPLGLLADLHGRRLNVNDWRIDSGPFPKPLPPVIVVAGTAMNAGKTTAAARLIRGLVRAGKRVGAAKVTGTGAGGDYWQMKDAGACEVVDFTDAGYASTYQLASQEIEKVFLRLLSHLGSLKTDVIVVEVADGVLQAETAALLASPGFSYYCDKLIFAASDAMGAVAGVQWLQSKGLNVHAVSGALTASPLAVRETSTALGLPVLSKQGLSDPRMVLELLADGGN
jgi:GTP-binding protein EngB required for normal cell division